MIRSQNQEAAIAKYAELAALIDRHTAIKGDGIHPMAITSGSYANDSLEFTRQCESGTVIPGICEPLLGIVVQGKKELLLNKEMIDCAIRLTKLLDTPQDIPFLAPTIVREIYYRLLSGEQGEAVRQIATSGSNMQRIAEVIRRINVDFAKPLRVDELAEGANMSASSFHRHFKAVTSMSPVQYQKQLKLLSARQIMLAENVDANQAAYQVGYESTSQFSREYSRMFGAPPHRDVERSRIA